MALSLYILLYRERSCLLLDFILLGEKSRLSLFHYMLGKLGAYWVQLGKEKAECHPIADYSFLKGGSGVNGAGLLSVGNSGRTQGRGMKLNQRKFRYTDIFVKELMKLPLVILFQLSLFNHSF